MYTMPTAKKLSSIQLLNLKIILYEGVEVFEALINECNFCESKMITSFNFSQQWSKQRPVIGHDQTNS